MQAVFPNCSDNAVFLNVIVSATVQTLNCDGVSTEGLLLKGKTMQLLNSELGSLSPCLSSAIDSAECIT